MFDYLKQLPLLFLVVNRQKMTRRDLFIWGMVGFLSTDASKTLSFFQVGGVHGLPYQAYNGDDSKAWTDNELKNRSKWGGYCHHGDVLFPTWHRPYVLLFEKAIIQNAIDFVNSQGSLSPADKEAALKLASQLRLPFIDWATQYTMSFGLPDIFTKDQVS